MDTIGPVPRAFGSDKKPANLRQKMCPTATAERASFHDGFETLVDILRFSKGKMMVSVLATGWACS